MKFPLECGTLIKIKGRKGMQAHLEDDCPLTEFDCSRCEEQVERQAFEDHDCQSNDQQNNEELIETLIKDVQEK